MIEKTIKAESSIKEIQYELSLISEKNLTTEDAANLIVLLENIAIIQENLLTISADAISKLNTGLKNVGNTKK